MSHKILVPVSGKIQGERAVNALAPFRSLLEGNVIFLHAIEPISNRMAWTDHKQMLQEAEAKAEELIPRLLAYARQENINYRVCIDEGMPVDVIIKYAHEEKCDLIIMFTDGRDGVGDMLLGSITERVLRNSDLPLLVIHQ